MNPWLSLELIEYLNKTVNSEFDVFEYGSGSSTMFFAQRAKTVTSVENDFEWYKKVKADLERLKITNVNLIHIPHDDETSKDFLNPLAYSSNSNNYRFKVFRKYAKVIDDFGLFDLVLVDGRARISCAYHAKNHVKDGGVVVLDDAERSYYKPSLETYNDWSTKVIVGEKGKRTNSFLFSKGAK